MRLLPVSLPVNLSDLELHPRHLRFVEDVIDATRGLILCVGPTGSGKTTTLHSVLRQLNRPDTKIWTVEDPVEVTQYGLRQVQVMPHIGVNFAAVMRSFLRADPDVIMVGEMRDRETAMIGVEAALTGHLVLSTLHSGNSVETVSRLLDLGLDPYNFSDALLLIVAQRLVRRLCDSCKVTYHPTAEEFDELSRRFGGAGLALEGVQYNDDFCLFRGAGCPTCHGSGFVGRLAIHEVLHVTEPVRLLIRQRAMISEISDQANREGLITLVQDGILKVCAGHTDYRQVRVLSH
jgi:type II secretory ATPase GspE/PulE/Tfp pilus assembly ATPase PilB-like protein